MRNELSKYHCTRDARGRRCFDYFRLLSVVQDEKSLALLRSHFLGDLVVTPAVEIRFSIEDPLDIRVTRHGTGCDAQQRHIIGKRALASLRRLYVACEARGWHVQTLAGQVRFYRSARVSLARPGRRV